MKGWVSVVLGVLLVLAGLVWSLQGFNVMGGSAMSGKTMWAVIGPIVVVVGLVLVLLGSRWVRRAGASQVRS
ncbi:MAG TPA: hypothetical protein VGJ07_02105 [Rugosimonospora sp.]|jgi:hypothetical protein